jgi:outer membrane lipoprotein-sorting protein
MMKKMYSTLFLVFITTLMISAQVPKSMGKSDPDAKKLLDGISTKFKKHSAIQAKFSLKIENASGKSLESKTGTVYMKGAKYRITVTGEEIFSDGSNVWTYDKSSNEVTISKIDPSANSITPQKLFTNFYDKDFLYKLNGSVKMNGKTMKEIELTPVDKTKPFFKVLVYVDNSSNSLQTNGKISDATFVFDAKKYPGVEVVDLR